MQNNSTIEKDYVTKAENVMKSLGKINRNNKYIFELTTSKIRGILTLVNNIYNDVTKNNNEYLSEDIQSKIKYLKLRMVYEAGRENSVKNFLIKADLLNQINNIGNSRKLFLNFVRYMEALVAYHRFLGGRND
jgi:CRISPR-associated protein Csm2